MGSHGYILHYGTDPKPWELSLVFHGLYGENIVLSHSWKNLAGWNANVLCTRVTPNNLPEN
jgi:hypothetical protein